MSKFIDKLDKLSRGEFQPIGFKVMQSVSSKPRIQLVASVAQESIESLAESVSEADAGLLRISKSSSAAKAFGKMSKAFSSILWGGVVTG
ncbi:hypothetical protein ACFLVQ_00015 [Chloroflexota bacterium]